METPFRTFPVVVRDLVRLSPSFLRVTFTSEELDEFADHGRDMRIKLVFPAPDGGYEHLPTGPDWYALWRVMPVEKRPPFRTYTVRAVRPGHREVDVDIVLHGDGGPAARWANRVKVGDPLILLGPNARYTGETGGIEFRPHRDDAPLLLAGDETAVPAVAAILEELPDSARGEALLEVPLASDVLDLTAPTGIKLTWLARDGAAHGSALVPAVSAAVDRLVPVGTPAPQPPTQTSQQTTQTPTQTPTALEDVDIDTTILWEVPEAATATAGIYAWLAGEAGVIKTLRRLLVSERGIDRRTVAFMGYWRIGRAEGD